MANVKARVRRMDSAVSARPTQHTPCSNVATNLSHNTHAIGNRYVRINTRRLHIVASVVLVCRAWAYIQRAIQPAMFLAKRPCVKRARCNGKNVVLCCCRWRAGVDTVIRAKPSQQSHRTSNHLRTVSKQPLLLFGYWNYISNYRQLINTSKPYTRRFSFQLRINRFVG